MKNKDITESLKKEHRDKSVPDVFSRVRKAPINKLLDGQSPLRAFDKTSAVRALWIALALFVVFVFALSVFALMPKTKDVALSSYVRISVESGGQTTVYGFIVNDEKAVLCVLEKDGAQQPLHSLNLSGSSVKDAINGVYRAKSGDKVAICALDGNSAYATELAQSVKTAVSEAAQSQADIETTTSVNDAAVIEDLRRICGAQENCGIESLIEKYIETFS